MCFKQMRSGRETRREAVSSSSLDVGECVLPLALLSPELISGHLRMGFCVYLVIVSSAGSILAESNSVRRGPRRDPPCAAVSLLFRPHPAGRGLSCVASLS